MHNRVGMIVNPVTQGQRFDPKGDYVRRFVPELERLNGSEVHTPWEAPAAVQSGLDCPEPIAELKASRARALAAFKSISGEASR